MNLLRDKSGKQRFWKEGISYEHQYNSRLDQQYPARGKVIYKDDKMIERDLHFPVYGPRTRTVVIVTQSN